MGKRVPIGRTMVLFFRGVRGHPQHRTNPHFMSYGHPCFFCGGILFQFQVVRCWRWSEYGQRSRGFLARHPIYTVAQAWPTPDKAFRSRAGVSCLLFVCCFNWAWLSSKNVPRVKCPSKDVTASWNMAMGTKIEGS